MYKLILADDTVLDVGLVGSYDGGPLYIEVHNKTFVECAQIFSDPAKTARMVYDYVVGQHEYAGYTQLITLNLESGMIKVTMREETAA